MCLNKIIKAVQSFTLAIIILIVVTLISCDPGVTYNKIIQNDSDFRLEIYSCGDTAKHMYSIPDHSEMSINGYEGLGQAFEFENCDYYTDSMVVKIYNKDSLHLSFDINDRSNWTFRRIKKQFKDAGECECRVRIENQDIVK